jgi:glycosyltransferase involved in cell wall biosynthesis
MSNSLSPQAISARNRPSGPESPVLSPASGRRILFLAPQLPSPTRQGAAIRNWNLMVQLAKTHQLDLITFGHPAESSNPQPGQGRTSVPWRQIVTVPAPRRAAGRRLKTLLLSGQPDMADRLWSPLFLRQLAGLISLERYDIIQAEGIELARYLLLIARYRLPDYNPLLVFDDHNAEYLLQRRAAQTDLKRSRGWAAGLYSVIQQGRLRHFEARAMAIADLTLCVSEADAAALQPLAPQRPLIIAPNGVDATYYSPEGIPRERPRFDVIFSGTLDYRPNVDAVNWFAGEVWPLLKAAQDPRRERPLRLALVGRNPLHEVTRLVQQPGITVTGSVADDRPYFAGATVYVLPMRYGGGVRLKLLNALAMGCAVVSTTAGAEGLSVRHEEHLLLADSAADFAAAVGRLIDDDALRARLGAAGRAFVRDNYDWASIAARIVAGYEAGFAMRLAAQPVPAALLPGEGSASSEPEAEPTPAPQSTPEPEPQ